MSEPDFSKAYALTGGEMNGCLGAACSRSCCREKELMGQGEVMHRYRTTLIDIAGVSEAEYQAALERAQPLLDELGVTIQTVRTRTGTAEVTLVNGCLDPETGCKLAVIGRKPVLCRTYPFRIVNPAEADSDCPALDEIRENSRGTVETVIKAIDSALSLSKSMFQAMLESRARNRRS